MQAPGTDDALCGTTLEGRFTIERFVAQGGFGAVYRGTHCALRCPVAIKLLVVPERFQGSARARFLEAFEQEARTVAALKHPAIVRVLDFGTTRTEAQRPFMVLEWLDGETLETVLRSPSVRRSPREAFELLRPVFDAIASAHEAGVVHRDLKPGNVMVMPSRRGEIATRVLDFGVAKAMQPDAAVGDEFARTGDDFSSFSLSHAAPEQVGRLRTGPWTDVHALGLMLLETLAGERAYRGGTSLDLFSSITSRTRPSAAALGLNVGPWEAILSRSMALLPSVRHANAAALLAELDASIDEAQRAWERPLHTATQPASDRPPTLPPVQRSTRIRMAAVALVTALAMSVGAYGLSARHRGAGTLRVTPRTEVPVTPVSPPPGAAREAPTVAPPMRGSSLRVAPQEATTAPPARAALPRPRRPLRDDEIPIE